MINRLAICAVAFYVLAGVGIAVGADPMLVTGGTTRTLMRQADIPVLMSH